MRGSRYELRRATMIDLIATAYGVSAASGEADAAVSFGRTQH